MSCSLTASILAATENGVWRSPDAGATWTRIDTFTNAPTLDVGSVVVGGGNSIFAAIGSVVISSIDDGVTWDFTQFEMDVRALMVASNDDFWVAGELRVWKFTDSGQSISPVNDGLVKPQITTALVQGASGQIYLATAGTGAWVLGASGVATESPELPEKNLLLEAWPNPFVDDAAIHFQTDGAGPVSVVVFDLLGRRVATLMTGSATAGEHTLFLGGAKLSPGPYFVRLETSRGVTTKVLQKLR